MTWKKVRAQKSVAAVLHKLETTAGTDAVPVLGTDDGSFLRFAWQPQIDQRGRPIITPFGPGATKQVGLALMSFTGELDLQVGAISAADGSDDHSFVRPARYSGWKVVRNATDNTITLFCDPEDEQTATIYASRGVAGADEHNRTRLRRAMAAWQISYDAGGGLIFGLTGGNAELAVADMTTEASNLSGFSLRADPVVRAESATVRLYDPAAASNALFGGGSLATPGAALSLINYQLNSNRRISPLPGVSGGFGVSGFGAEVNGDISGRARFMLPKYGTWNFIKQALESTPLYFGVDFPTPGVSSTTTRLAHYIQVSNARLSDLSSITVVDVDFDVIYPADVSDNDPVAGSNPSQKWGANTTDNIGLIDATSISGDIPAGSPVFMQTKTT